MVKKILGFLYGEAGTINQTALLLGVFAFLSQILAFFRDRLLAHFFGASSELDVYYAAFRIPDFIFVTIASLVSLSVLVPFIVEKENANSEELKSFLGDIFSFFTLIITVTCSVVFFLMPWLVSIFFRGLNAADLDSVTLISRLLLLSPIFLGFSNLLGSITQAHNRFVLYAIAPLLYNMGIILGIFFTAEKLGIVGVAIGVVAGAFMHVAVQAPFVIKEGLWPSFSFRFNTKSIIRVVKISLPRTLTLSMSSVVLILLLSFASYLSTGSISILSFSINLQSVPLSIIGVSYSLAAFPTLSRRFQEKNLSAFLEQIQISARFIIFWSVLVTALIIILSSQIVRVVLGTGLFDLNATRLTSVSLSIFVFSSVFQSLLLLFMRGFYSAGYTRAPLIINLFSTFLTIILGLAFTRLFEFYEHFKTNFISLLGVEGVEGSAVLMLPLAYSVGMIVNCIILWAYFEKEFNGFTQGIYKTLIQSFFASLALGFTSYSSLGPLGRIFDTSTTLGLFSQGLFAGLAGILMALLILIVFRSPELYLVRDSLTERFWKRGVIATDPEIV